MTILSRACAVIFLAHTAWVHACTSIIVGSKASASGRTMIARTSDTIDARRGKNLQIYYDRSEKLYTGLPYADLEANPNFDMAQVMTNKYGVSVSATETIQSSPQSLFLDRPSTEKMNGVSEPNIPSIVMPNAKTARDAVRILGEAIESRGVYSNKGFGVLFADSTSAWYLETLSAHQWVAIKIPDDVYFVAANGPGQIQEYAPERYTYAMSHYDGQTPMEFATLHHIAVEKNGYFNFRATFADVHNPLNRNINYVRLAYLQHYFNPSTHAFDESALDKGEYPMFLQPEHPITLTDLKTLQASHYEDFPAFDPYTRFNKDETIRPYYYPIANVRTSNGHVTVIDSGHQDNTLGNVEYIALGMPTVSFYIPIYFGMTEKPYVLTGVTSVADDYSLFWEFRKLQTLVFLTDPAKGIDFDFKARIALVKERYLSLTATIAQLQYELEKNYRAHPDDKLIDVFMDDMLRAISQTNQQLIAHFMTQLDIDNRYALKSPEARNQWFTAMVRQQDCNYRKNRCRPVMITQVAVPSASVFRDEPVL